MPEINRTASRADHAPPDEKRAGTDAPTEQAEAILEDSDARQADRDAAPGTPGTVVEHRRSEETL